MTTEQKKQTTDSSSAAPTAVPVTGIHTDPVESFKCAECGHIIDVKGLPSFSEIACPSCGTKASVPARLSNFLLLKLMGTGGMGGVYYARDEELGRFVAIKVMLESLGSDPAFIETFRREAQAVAKLNHPNIAQIYSYGQEKGQPYIVMELVSGERVDAMMDADGSIKPALAMRIGLEIAQGLSAADEAGLVHGDIKPENILLDPKGRAKLVDFGLATVAHQAAGEGIWGTPYYIAPEKIKRQKVDARSDIYSLGATLFHMLTGKPPFEGKTPVEVVKARLEQPPPDPRQHMPNLPEIIGQTILRMLAVDRTERYPNYLSLISDLRKSVETLGSAPTTTARFSSGKHIRFKNRKGGGAKTTAQPKAAGGSPSGGGSRKLVIHKDGRRTSTVKGNLTTRTGTASISISAGQVSQPTPKPTPEELAAKTARIRRHKRNVWITVTTIVLILAAAGGITAWLMHRQEEIEKRKALFAISTARQESTERYISISNEVMRINKQTAKAETILTDIKTSVERVAGIKLAVETPAPPTVIAPTAPGADGTNTVAAVSTSTNNSAVAAAGVTPIGEGTNAKASEFVEVDAGSSQTAAGPEAAKPAVDVPDHPIIAPAREALQTLLDIVNMNTQANDMLDEARLLTDAVQASKSASGATAGAAKLRGLAEQVDALAALVKTRIEHAEAGQQRVTDFRQEFDRAEAARIAAEKAAEEARLAAEKAERERREYEARTATERQNAKNDRADVKGLFDANQFEDALAQLKQRAANYQTEKGKAAIGVLIDRYAYLASMKAALIAGMQKTRFPWGWGFGSSARDIENADANGISVTGTSAPVPWSSVLTPQLLKLIDFYLQSRGLRARARIDLAFGAAIYCDELVQGRDDLREQGLERARQYANRAMDLGLPRETFARLIEAGWAEALD